MESQEHPRRQQPLLMDKTSEEVLMGLKAAADSQCQITL